ncbi:hypothetical protein ES702_01844 [subsurface metagenome]
MSQGDWCLIVILAFFILPFLIIAVSISRISDDEVNEWHKGLVRQVRHEIDTHAREEK